VFEKNISAILASLSIGGLAIGLAAQDTLANLFGAVAVFVDKPFRIGDRIKVDSVDGNVEVIGLRSTRVRTLDGHLASIPNKTVGSATIVNVTERPTIKTEMNLGVTYDTSAENLRLALRIVEEVYRGHAKTSDLIVSFNRFADSALNIQVIHWWGGTDFREQLAGMQEMNLKLKERFDASGISFAFPTQTLYVRPVAG
jgi:MscS family membrane protein